MFLIINDGFDGLNLNCVLILVVVELWEDIYLLVLMFLFIFFVVEVVGIFFFVILILVLIVKNVFVLFKNFF